MILRTIKTSALILGLALIGTASWAQAPKNVTPKIKEATVFLQGAELTHSATAAVTKGENEIIFDGLSPEIDLNSLKISATNSIVISASEFSIDYLSAGKEISPVLARLDDSIAMHQAKLDKTIIDINVNKSMAQHLQLGMTKNVSGSEKGLEISELIKTMDYYKVKSEELEVNQLGLYKKKTDLESAISKLKSQRAQESLKGNKNSGVLKLTMTAPMASSATFTISYYTPSASWAPYYDIKIAAPNQPLIVAAKSKVRQTTGQDWDKVKLTLSTATPSNGKYAPTLSTWFLEQRNIRIRASKSYDDVSNDELQEVVALGYGTPISKKQAEAAAPQLIVIDGIIASEEDLKDIDPRMIKDIRVIDEKAAASLYGSRSSSGAKIVILKTSIEDYVSESDNTLSAVFAIDMPYSIPGNGKVQNIDLTTKEIMADYTYFSAPRLDTETFLKADITDWQKLGLLSGKANITYNNTYIGETYIETSSTDAKLSLTLGTDKRVTVKRTKLADFSSVKFMDSDIFQIFTYEITVRNNQKTDVKMVISDQYPISTQKSIEVILRKETTPTTTNNKETGIVTWENTLAPGETKTYQISYSVKYPKNMTLNF